MVLSIAIWRKKMIILNVFINIEPSQKDKFLNILSELVQKSQQEAGNDYYNYFSRENEFVVIEYWKNAEALDAHNQSEHFNHFVTEVVPLLSEPLRLEKYTSH